MLKNRTTVGLCLEFSLNLLSDDEHNLREALELVKTSRSKVWPKRRQHDTTGDSVYLPYKAKTHPPDDLLRRPKSACSAVRFMPHPPTPRMAMCLHDSIRTLRRRLREYKLQTNATEFTAPLAQL